MKLPARDLLAIPLVVFAGVFLAEVTVMEWLEGSSVLDVRSEYSAYLDGALIGLVAAVVYWASRGAWKIGRDGRPWIANAVILAFVAATYEIAVHQAVTDPHLSLNPLALSVLNGVLVAGVAGGCAAWLMFIDRRVDAANDDPAPRNAKVAGNFIAAAVCVAVCVASVPAVMAWRETQAWVRATSSAQIVNLAARQRMLSQRTARLVLLKTPDARAQLATTLDDLADSRARLSALMQDYSGARDLSDEQAARLPENAQAAARGDALALAARQWLQRPGDARLTDIVQQRADEYFAAAESAVREVQLLEERNAEDHLLGALLQLTLGPIMLGALAFSPMWPMLRLVSVQHLRLQNAASRADEANRAKSTFLSNMSHEIRTPLNGMIGLTDVLARDKLDPRQQELVDLIRTSGHLLQTVLNDILDVSKIEAGKLELDVRPINLRREIEAAAFVLRAKAQEKGLDFEVEFSESVEGHFRGDPLRLRQIVSNLTSNAVKFTARGAVRISVHTSAEHRVVIRVEDTGPGFDEAFALRMFRRFEQADSSITRSHGGTGLGLAITKSLIDLMDGEILVASTKGVGSTFTATLPLERADEPATTGPDDALSAAEAPQFALRILLAEDNPANQRVVSFMLEPFGVALTTSDNGAQALAALQAQDFDLVLMDMQMPIMDGLAATRAIRAWETAQSRPRTPIVMLTANAMEDHKRQAVEAGCDLHVAKPITPSALLGAIEAALNGSEKAAIAA